MNSERNDCKCYTNYGEESDLQEDTSTNQGAKCAHLVNAYQGTLANNSLYHIDFRQRNLHNL
jgi:hypothetical protein